MSMQFLHVKIVYNYHTLHRISANWLNLSSKFAYLISSDGSYNAPLLCQQSKRTDFKAVGISIVYYNLNDKNVI